LVERLGLINFNLDVWLRRQVNSVGEHVLSFSQPLREVFHCIHWSIAKRVEISGKGCGCNFTVYRELLLESLRKSVDRIFLMSFAGISVEDAFESLLRGSLGSKADSELAVATTGSD
jgi:hypothetical protein